MKVPLLQWETVMKMQAQSALPQRQSEAFPKLYFIEIPMVSYATNGPGA